MSELYQDRVLGGIVKGGLAASFEQAQELLDRDIEIFAPPERASLDDLWPCIWALCACLERQFSGTIHVVAGLSAPLPCPVTPGMRCSFGTRSEVESPLQIFVGETPRDSLAIWGDARGLSIGYQRLLNGSAVADSIACFGLAGYLGYAALALAAKLPGHREAYRKDGLTFSSAGLDLPIEITCVGSGQLGQAYLALLYFASLRSGQRPTIVLIDRDRFEESNGRTQILLPDKGGWIGEFKVEYVAELARSWQWNAQGVVQELHWGWKRAEEFPGLALLGLDDLDVRRMAVAAGFDWLVDAGVGTSLSQPRITWHQLPPETALANRLFGNGRKMDSASHLKGSAIHDKLMKTPGGCGWVTFENLNATAPSMGLVAAAYTVSELMSHRTPIAGAAYLWSSLLPPLRENLI